MSKRVRLFLSCGLSLYGLLWFLTHVFGAPQVRQEKVGKFSRFPEFTDISKIGGQRVSGPVYYCRTATYLPFVVQVEYGWSSGPFSGDGGTTLYVWVFGLTFPFWEHSHWSDEKTVTHNVVFSPAGGTYTNFVMVYLFSSNALIHYTLDESDPTEKSAALDRPLMLADMTVLKVLQAPNWRGKIREFEASALSTLATALPLPSPNVFATSPALASIRPASLITAIIWKSLGDAALRRAGVEHVNARAPHRASVPS